MATLQPAEFLSGARVHDGAQCVRGAHPRHWGSRQTSALLTGYRVRIVLSDRQPDCKSSAQASERLQGVVPRVRCSASCSFGKDFECQGACAVAARCVPIVSGCCDGPFRSPDRLCVCTFPRLFVYHAWSTVGQLYVRCVEIHETKNRRKAPVAI